MGGFGSEGRVGDESGLGIRRFGGGRSEGKNRGRVMGFSSGRW